MRISRQSPNEDGRIPYSRILGDTHADRQPGESYNLVFDLPAACTSSRVLRNPINASSMEYTAIPTENLDKMPITRHDKFPYNT